MFFIQDTTHTLYEEKKSKFYSFLTPYENFENLHEELKLQHPKARHIIWAYRYINKENQIVENSTDDEEPKGSAGKPTLSVMRGKELVNCAILTVRYFGGIKLGIGGMVRAYTSSANLVVDNAMLEPFKDYQYENISIEYPLLSKFEYYCEQNGIVIEEKLFEQKVSLKLKYPKELEKIDFQELIYHIS